MNASERAAAMQPVHRFVVTHINREGVRQLTFAAQGRNTFETELEARQHLVAVLANNTPTQIAGVYGVQACGTFDIRLCACWPVHFDPMGIYFDH